MAKVLMKGNEAVGKAAIEAGCRYFLDSLRAAEFQKFSREIIVASKLGGPDPAGNFRLSN